MGSGGTEFETADIFDNIRLNQKTRFVGTGLQATTFLSSPQIGQTVYCTETDATFTKEKLGIRNSANDTWLINTLAETSRTLGAVGTGGENWNEQNTRHYEFHTLPTSEKYYIITSMAVAMDTDFAKIVMGVDLVNATTPTIDHTVLVALSQWKQVDSLNGTVTLSCASKVIKGGTIIGAWCNYVDTAGGSVSAIRATTAATSYRKAETWTASPTTGESTAFSTTTKTGMILINYYGFS